MEVQKYTITLQLPVTTLLSKIDLVGFWYVKECVGVMVTLEKVVPGLPTDSTVLTIRDNRWFYWGGQRGCNPITPLMLEINWPVVSLYELLRQYYSMVKGVAVHKAMFTEMGVMVLPTKKFQTLGEGKPNTGLQIRICVGQNRKVYGLGFLNSVVGMHHTWQVYAAKNEFVFVQTDDSTTPRLEYDCKVGKFTAVLSDKEEIITQIAKCELSTTLSDVVKLYEDLINKE